MIFNTPKTFFAGETLKFTQTSDKFKPSEGWDLEISITNGVVRYSITGTKDLVNEAWTFELAPALTKDYIPASYDVFARVLKGTEVYVIEESTKITIKADPFSGNGIDNRTFAEYMVDILREALKENAPSHIKRMVIGSRQLEMYDKEDINKLLKQYENTVELERLKKENGSQYGAYTIYLRG